MYKEIIEKYYVFIAIILFFMSYLIWWPYNWMITDSMSYSTQAIAFANGQLIYNIQDFISGESINIIKSPYSLGTASYLSVFVALFGQQGIFAGSLISVLGSIVLLSKTLKRNGDPTWAVSLALLSIPLLFFSRSLMSCMPSLLVISTFTFLFYKDKYLWRDWLTLGFVAGLSAWFRETNAILLAPFCLYLIYEKKQSFIPVFLGGIIGLAIKFISSYIVYGKLWFVSASSGFSIDNLMIHLPLYLFITIGLIPAGLIFVFMTKNKASIALKISISLFVLMYILYNYSAVPFSGFAKGSLLTSRFMIPLIPFIIIAFGDVLSRKKHLEWLGLYIGVPLSILLIPLSQFAFHTMYSNHESAAMELSELIAQNPVMYDQSGYTNIIRYMNPLTISLSESSDIRNFIEKNVDKIPTDSRIVVSMSTGNLEKVKRTEEIQKIVLENNAKLLRKIDIDSENWLEVYVLDK